MTFLKYISISYLLLLIINGSLAGIVRRPLTLLSSVLLLLGMVFEIYIYFAFAVVMLEVLESERLVLLNEKANLGYRVKALVEENKGLAFESMFVKWKAGELGKCVVKMREDHRVFLLHRKIEDLQAQINGLEKRNKEYYQQLLVRDNKGQDDDDNSGCLEKKGENSDGIALEIQLHMQG